jgi:filamentous hemagglutinin family protein
MPLLGLTLSTPGQAQIIPDATLPQNSVVNPGCTDCTINGGTIRGANLFHSFREFSIPRNGAARFNNDPSIQTILTRVTGNRASEINGLLQTNAIASLFLLNPNGIVFGPTARLQVGGSFLATTASSFKLSDGSEFSAPNPTAPLLTVSVPIGLQFGPNPAPILSQARIALTPTATSLPRKTLALVGGNINLNGGAIQVINGQIELGAVGGSGLVELLPSPSGFTLGYSPHSTVQDIQLTGAVLVGVSGTGGGVMVNARNLRLQDGSRLVSLPTGSGSGGDLRVNATEMVELSGTANSQAATPSGFLTTTATNGTAGTITVSARQVNLLGGAQILSITNGSGNAGAINIKASDSVTAIGTASRNSRISSGIVTQALPSTTGNVGALRIDTNALSVMDGAQISSVTFGAGSAGTLRVNAMTINLSGVALTPAGEMVFSQPKVPIVSGLFASADAGSTGNAAALIVNTQQLRMQGGAAMQTSTLGTGDAGNLFITADAIALSGTAPDGISPTAILAVSGGIPRSGIGVPSAIGKGGAIAITTNHLTVEKGAEIAVSGLNPNGASKGAGNLQIQANSITLRDRARLNAETSSGNGGDIKLQVQGWALLRRGSTISATAGTAQVGGNGGNITIRAPFIIGVPQENSDITANAFTGRGGNITITTNGIYGLKFQPKLTPLSDITASSEFGLNGTVTIDILDIDPNRGLVALPTNLTDPSQQIAQTCVPPIGKTASSFVVTGRGGIPVSPDEPLESQVSIMTRWVRLPEETVGGSRGERVRGRDESGMMRRWDDAQHTPSPPPTHISTHTLSPIPLVEATGWIVHPNGQVELVAEVPRPQPSDESHLNPYTQGTHGWLVPLVCQGVQ